MRIRPVQIGDYERGRGLLEQIQTIHAQNRPDIFKDAARIMPEEVFQTFLNTPEDLSSAAEEDGILCGICLVSVREHAPQDFVMTQRRYASVEVLCVEPEYRRRGVAEALLGYAKQRAAGLALDSIELEVAAFNAPAKALYEKLCFTPQSYTLEWKITKEEN